MNIDEIIAGFENEDLAIDYSDATEDQMKQLEDILNDKTDIRPHDNMSYAEHMSYYIKDNYGFLAKHNDCAASYRNSIKDCRPTIVSLEAVLEAADSGQSAGISETEFDNMF